MRRYLSVCVLVLCMACLGCPKKVPPPSLTGAQDNGETLSEDFSTLPGLLPVYFDFDSSSVKLDQSRVLKDNVKYLKKIPSSGILVEGHCDERGTIEYNLALGQRRADVIRDYYISMGIEKDRISTVSFGKERPDAPGHDQSAWAKNRRAVTLVRKNR